MINCEGLLSLALALAGCRKVRNDFCKLVLLTPGHKLAGHNTYRSRWFSVISRSRPLGHNVLLLAAH